MRIELILRNFWKYNDKNQIELVRGIDLVLIFYSRPVAEQEESTHPPLQLDKHPEQSTPALFLPLHAPMQVVWHPKHMLEQPLHLSLHPFVPQVQKISVLLLP